VLAAGGTFGNILGPGGGVGVHGGVQEVSGEVVPDGGGVAGQAGGAGNLGGQTAAGGINLFGQGQAMTPDQTVAFTQLQSNLLEQWAQVIDPTDPRWPQVLALVNQQAMAQVTGGSNVAAGQQLTAAA
jgi:hypothetical protein